LLALNDVVVRLVALALVALAIISVRCGKSRDD